LSLEQKSNQGIRLLDGRRIDAVVLAKVSAILLPEMPVQPRTQRNWISKPAPVKEKRRLLICSIRELGDDSKTLEEIDYKQESESVAIRNLHVFGCKVKMS